jgi:hypothetical protein
MQQPPSKRLRVNTDGGALDNDNTDSRRSAPKHRISHACDRCRSRRAKCDGSQPTCVACAAAHVTCTYGTQTKKRGLRTGYVRLLELLWVLVFDSVPGAEDATLQLLNSASVVAGDAGVALLHNANGSTRDREKLLTQDLWARSKLREAIDARVLKIDAAAGSGSERESTHRVICEGIPLPTACLIEPWTALPWNTQIAQSELCASSNAPENTSPANVQVELPDDAWAQIGIYLSYSYCWFPVVPKHDIVRLLSRRQDDAPCTASEMALLWSALAVSASLKTEPDQSLVAVYHSEAIGELGKDDEQLSTHHIAAILLLALSKMELQQWKDAYLLVGRAARLAHYMYNTTSQSDSTLSRVYLGTFILDTLLSSYLGIPTVPTQHIMPVLSVYEADGPEEWDAGSWSSSSIGELQCPSRAMSIFGQVARLMVVLNTATALGSRPLSADDKLSEWRDQLPKHCSPQERPGPLTPPLANLEMIYWVVKAYISGGTHAKPSSIAEYTRIFGTHASKSILHICRRLSKCSTHKFGYEREKQPVDVARDDTLTETGLLPDLSFTFTQRARSGVNNTQHSIDDSMTYMPDSLHPGSLRAQSLAQSRHSPTSLVLGNAFEQPYRYFDGNLGQDLDDTDTMQTMLENILTQEVGNEPFSSSFMQDLGFFDEEVPLPDGPV